MSQLGADPGLQVVTFNISFWQINHTTIQEMENENKPMKPDHTDAAEDHTETLKDSKDKPNCQEDTKTSMVVGCRNYKWQLLIETYVLGLLAFYLLH